MQGAKPKSVWTRVDIFAFGMFIACEGMALFHHGVLVYQNYYRAEMYSPTLTVTGVVFMILALIPDSLVERVVRIGRRSGA